MNQQSSKRDQPGDAPFPAGESTWQDTRSAIQINVVPTEHPTDPRIYELLKPLILDLVMTEDLIEPLRLGFNGDALTREYTDKLREPIVKLVRASGIKVSAAQLRRICHRTGSEVLVVRGMSASIALGEITLGDITHLELYTNYRDYFDKTPACQAKAAEIATKVAASIPRPH